METLMNLLKWVTSDWTNAVSSVVSVLGALIVIFSVIPGEQPEKTLQGIVDFLKKFSRK